MLDFSIALLEGMISMTTGPGLGICKKGKKGEKTHSKAIVKALDLERHFRLPFRERKQWVSASVRNGLA